MTSTTGLPSPLPQGGGFISRQAVFDAHREIWGYELLYRRTLTQARPTAEEHRQLLGTAASSFLNPLWRQQPGAHVLVDLDPRLFVEDTLDALPKAQTAFLVREEMLASPALQALMLRLRGEGSLICLTDFSGRLDDATLAPLNILGVDMLSPDKNRLLRQARETGQRLEQTVLARNVDDARSFAAARTAGCALFHGFFFQKPERIIGRTVPGPLLSSLNILNLAERSDPDLSQLARAIQKDVTLSYRLLRFLNSPYFGFTRPVSSIRVALILAGWRQVRTWLRLVLLTEMKPQGKPGELVFLSAQRGRFLELAAQGAAELPGQEPVDPDRLVLLGLFSLLDGILDMDMGDVVEALPLDMELKDTLCGEGTALSPWLDLVHGFERADWGGLSTAIHELGLNPAQVAAQYTESMAWGHAIFNYLN